MGSSPSTQSTVASKTPNAIMNESIPLRLSSQIEHSAQPSNKNKSIISTPAKDDPNMTIRQRQITAESAKIRINISPKQPEPKHVQLVNYSTISQPNSTPATIEELKKSLPSISGDSGPVKNKIDHHQSNIIPTPTVKSTSETGLGLDNVLKAAAGADLSKVNFDLLGLINQIKPTATVVKRSSVGKDSFFQSSLGEFPSDAQIDNSTNITDTARRIVEFNDKIRYDTDLLSLVRSLPTSNKPHNSSHSSESTDSQEKKKGRHPNQNHHHHYIDHDRQSHQSNNIPFYKRHFMAQSPQSLVFHEDAVYDSEDLNISPISQNQFSINTFQEFTTSSFAAIDQEITSATANVTTSAAAATAASTHSPRLFILPEELIGSRRPLGNSVRFRIQNLEKIRESDEKDEEVFTNQLHTNQQNSVAEKIPEEIVKKPMILHLNKNNSIRQISSSSFTSNSSGSSDEEEEDFVQKPVNQNQQKSNFLNICDFKNVGKHSAAFDLNKRSSVFFQPESRNSDDSPLKEDYHYPQKMTDSCPTISKGHRSASIQIGAKCQLEIAQKRHSAFTNIKDFQRNSSPGEHEKNNYLTASQNGNQSFNAQHHDTTVIETSNVTKQVDDSGNKIINQYILIKELGRGGFGKVKLARLRDQVSATKEESTTREASDHLLDEQQVHPQQFAIKISNKRKLKQRMVSMKVNAFLLLEREVAIMKKIDHPHLVKLFEVIEDPYDEKIYLVMEFMQKGSIMSPTYWKKELESTNPELFNKIFSKDTNELSKQQVELLPKRLSQEKCRQYFQQFALAIDYMHNCAQVIHRDIKPENILIDELDNLKIADFGVSHIMESTEDNEITSNAGTKAFTAPEGWSRTFKGKPLDMWASGVTLFFIAFGYLPFMSKDQIKLRNLIINEEVRVPEGTDHDLADLVMKLLEKNPNDRLTAKQMLSHPWLTENGLVLLQNTEIDVIQVSEQEVLQAITKKINFSTLLRMKIQMNKRLTLARSFIQLGSLDNSLNHYSNNTSPQNS